MFNQHVEPVLFTNELIEIRRTRFGIMGYLRHDVFIGQALARYGEYSYAEYDLFRQVIRPGYTVLDVGANLGAHTLAMAQLVGSQGRVLAFEPQPVVCDILSMNMMLNQATQVVVYRSPLMATSQKMYLPEMDYMQQYNYGDVAVSAAATPVVVFTTRLDDYELSRCDFIKIDVQGAELDVLTGAQATLARFRPLLYVENDTVEKSSRLIAGLLKLHYNLYWHFPPLYNPTNYFANTENIYPNILSMNMLCVPEEIKTNVALLPVDGVEDDFQKALKRLCQRPSQ